MDMYKKNYGRSYVLRSICVVLLFLTILTGCSSQGSSGTGTTAGEGIRVYMIDIGQGDAELIQAGEKNILIDSGDIESRNKIVEFLKAKGIQQLDTVIITHPHGDHMGGMAALFQNFKIVRIFDNGEAATNAMYKNYLSKIDKLNIPWQQLKSGDVVDLGDGVTFYVFAPSEPLFIDNGQPDLNNNSIVGKMVYKNFSVLFTGDAEQPAEKRILTQWSGNLQATILKVGHHGSKTSTSEKFLAAVHPQGATISLGAGNSYHFPHKQTMDQLKKLNVTVYRTDQSGTIEIDSDGNTFTVHKER